MLRLYVLDLLRVSPRECYTNTMTALFSDTHSKMEALQIQLLRQASPTRKVYGEISHAE